MEEGFARGLVENLQLYGSVWLHEHLLGAANLTQLGWVLVALVVAKLLAGRLAALAGEAARRRGSEGASGRMLETLPLLATPIAWLLLLWFGVAVALLVALETVGIDLTALAVFSGALGVGIGFGLQRIFANLVSGFILLMDRSIKPGDVVSVGDT